jgi:3-carboxy-cis,cis-muconate cycloisomerase
MTNALLRDDLFGDLFRDAEVSEEMSGGALLRRMIAFEAAWTRALVTNGVATAADGEAAQAALSAFDPAEFRAASDRDGLPVPSLVAALREGLSPGAAKAIHTGATSQDVIDTAMVLGGLALLDLFEARLDRLIAALGDLTTRFGDAPLMARTRMQAALPATAELRISGWQRLVRSQRVRLPVLRAEFGRVQIGGAIGLRDVPGQVAQDVADALGLALAPVWHNDRSSMVAFGHWLTLVAGALGKIGQDIALMAQQGLDEIALDGGGGSSAMPHKQNPVLAETMVALARHVAGMQGTLAQAMLHEQERSGAAWALEWLTLPAMAEATGASLRHAEKLVGSIRRIGTPG